MLAYQTPPRPDYCSGAWTRPFVTISKLVQCVAMEEKTGKRTTPPRLRWRTPKPWRPGGEGQREDSDTRRASSAVSALLKHVLHRRCLNVECGPRQRLTGQSACSSRGDNHIKAGRTVRSSVAGLVPRSGPHARPRQIRFPRRRGVR